MHVMEYKLRFLLNSLTLKIIRIKDLTDVERMAEFNSTYYDAKKIQGFCSKIGETTRFPVFNVPLEKNSTEHKVLFCEVSVGNSLFVSPQYAENTKELPAGTDSLITGKQDNVGFLEESTLQVQDCSYVVKDTRKILPLYEIVFEYDEEFERKSRGCCICHRCKKGEAVVFCPSEAANFCQECDKQVHFDSFLSRHERKYFADVGQKKFICCMYHPGKTVEYFCDECAEPICAECQITGKHSTREFSKHKIKPFLDACRAASDYIREGSRNLEGLEESVRSSMTRFKSSVTSFKSNMSTITRTLESELRALLREIESIESYNRQSLNAKLVEGMAWLETVKRMTSYPNDLDPADVLLGMKNIMEQRKTSSPVIFESVETKRFELCGKVSIEEVKTQASRPPASKSENQSVAWRVETKNLDIKAESTIN
ncbi:hypothetical protein PAEPH01_0585 [Pancytospora epiphaga]|nr:hypothetical protein PAEPH01_0585 [Pancytospora epiphaga]